MMDFESIAKAFPETGKDFPWFPDKPKLFLSALGGENVTLFEKCPKCPTFVIFTKKKPK